MAAIFSRSGKGKPVNNRQLRSVEALPDTNAAQLLLGLEAVEEDDA